MLLTVSYYLDLREAIKYIFGEVNSTHYTIADAADNIFKLGKKLYKEITKVDKIWKSRLPNYQNVITVKNYKLISYIKILVPPLSVRLKPNSVAVLL